MKFLYRKILIVLFCVFIGLFINDIDAKKIEQNECMPKSASFLEYNRRHDEIRDFLYLEREDNGIEKFSNNKNALSNGELFILKAYLKRMLHNCIKIAENNKLKPCIKPHDFYFSFFVVLEDYLNAMAESSLRKKPLPKNEVQKIDQFLKVVRPVVLRSEIEYKYFPLPYDEVFKLNEMKELVALLEQYDSRHSKKQAQAICGEALKKVEEAKSLSSQNQFEESINLLLHSKYSAANLFLLALECDPANAAAQQGFEDCLNDWLDISEGFLDKGVGAKRTKDINNAKMMFQLIIDENEKISFDNWQKNQFLNHIDWKFYINCWKDDVLSKALLHNSNMEDIQVVEKESVSKKNKDQKRSSKREKTKKNIREFDPRDL